MLAEIAISTAMVWLVFELALAVFGDRALAIVAAVAGPFIRRLFTFRSSDLPKR